MKKLMLLFIAATFTFVSCGSDDDSNNQDQIVGTWSLKSGSKGFIGAIEDDTPYCLAENTLDFDKNGSLELKYYYRNSVTMPCELYDIESRTWINNGDGSYTIMSALESLTFDITFDEFTFYFEETCIEDGETVTGRITYIRN